VTIAYAPSPTANATVAPAAATTDAPAASRSAAAPTTEECIGYGCSAAQDAALDQQEAAANDDDGSDCNYQLCGSDLPENQPGYSTPDDPLHSSGES